ncbi:anthranilate synthase component I family protein [Roseimarinus sediminis]|uniref:anthranilate synthase component I family protein n=1 Tax=Roseimarinus sediminis TaxID=1610899 RepID=UPI003D1B3D1E
MNRIKINTKTTKLSGTIADLVTPVSIYLKMRDTYPNTLLLESSDYHGSSNSMSYICFDEIATFEVNRGSMKQQLPGTNAETTSIDRGHMVTEALNNFLHAFEVPELTQKGLVNGLWGYTAYDAIRYFETISLKERNGIEEGIPEIRYAFHRYVIAINHFNNDVTLIENLQEGEQSKANELTNILLNQNVVSFRFKTVGNETSNITDDEYMQMVDKGKEHCFRGNVFQIVLSRRFSQAFSGDEFNVYRALRRINPSPYLFYFDYSNYKIFGSSPEAQLIVHNNKATINPIAGTFKRTGNDESDRQLAIDLAADKKENAEHVMLVDLARNDLSRNSSNVMVDNYREVQYYSHVLHLVSEVSGELAPGTNTIKVFGDTFPAGTLSGAPKYKAMEIIDELENVARSYYGGAIGFIGFNGNINHAITIRTFLSKNNQLICQAGAGIVSESKRESELQEVNNKLGALKKAIIEAENINTEISL